MGNYVPKTEEGRKILEKYNQSGNGSASTGSSDPASGSGGYTPKTDEGRRILAKYGMAEYTEDEKKELQSWANLAKRGYGNLQGYMNQLNTDDWASLSKDGYYRRALGQQIQEAQGYLKGLKKDSVTYKDASEYLANLQEIQKAFADRGDYYGQFKDEEEFNILRGISGARAEAKKKGESYNDYYLRTERGAARADEAYQAAQQRKTQMQQDVNNQRQYLSRTGILLVDGKILRGKAAEDYLQQRQNEVNSVDQEIQQRAQEAEYARKVSSYAKAGRYADLQDLPDYEQLLAAGGRAWEEEQARVNAGKTSERDIAINANLMPNNGLGGVSMASAVQVMRNDTSSREPQEDWTEQERNTFLVLFQRSPGEAYDYAIEINSRNANASYADKAKALSEWTNENGWRRALAWGAGVLSQPFAAADYLDRAMQYGIRGYVMPHSELTPADAADTMSAAAARYLNDTYGTIGENTPVLGGKGWGDVFQLSQSIAQSAAAASMGGGATNLLFFGSSANQGFRDAKGRGASDGEALILGFLNGSAEVLGETISVEKLIAIKNPATIRRYLWNVAKQGGIEASEETFTTILNTFADAIVMGDKSELQQNIRQNMAQGMSRAEAEKQAWQEWTEGLAGDALGGFLSGGISAGGRQAIGMIQSNASAYSGEDAQRLVEAGLEKKEGSAAYKLAQKIQEQGTMSELEAQRLTDLLGEDAEAIHRNQRAELKQEAERRLQEAGLGQRSAARSAETVTRELLGEELDREGRADRERDFQNETVRQVARQMEQERRTEALRRFVQAQADRTEKNSGKKVNAQLQRAFRASGIQLSEHELEILTDGFIPGSNRVNSYVIAARDGYRLGKSGMTLEQAAKSSDYAGKVYEQQFRHAWELGKQAAGGTVTESGTGPSKESTVQIKGQEGSSRILGLTRGADGKLQARVAGANGGEQTVSLSEIDFGESGLDELVDALKGRADAEQVFAAYHGGMSVGSYIRAWDTAKAYGQATGSRTVESVMQDSMLEGMDEASIRAAFAYGRSLKEQQKAKRGKSGPSQSQSDSSPRRGASQEASGKGEGGVSYDGGTVDGVKLRAVNRNRLTPKQRAQIRVVDALGQKFGIEFRLFESSLGKNGRYQSAYGMYKDGVIYLDVNAGRLGQSMGQVALVRTAAHELTHYIQDYAEERYQELQEFLMDYLAEWKGKDLGQLVAEKMQRDRTGKLTPEEALDEVVADGCEMMLRRTKVMQAMAEQKPGLFQAVKEWMQEWIQAVKEAFLGVSEVHDEARAVAQMETERLEKLVELWDKGLMEASERAAKSPAREGGAVKYQEREDDLSYENLPANAFFTDSRIYDYDFLTAQKPMKISSMPPIPHWSMTAKEIRDNARDSAEKNLAKIGKKDGNTYAVKNTYTGREIQVGMGAIRHSLAADNRADLVIKSRIISISGDLVQNAIPINGLVKENPQADGTYAMLGIATSEDATFAAVITVDQFSNVTEMEPIDVAHAINGRIKREDWSSSKDQPFRDNSSRLPQSSEITIAQVLDVVNETYKGILSDDVLKHFDEERPTTGYYHGRVLFQERDELPDDRALLMQARAEGRNAESLTVYQKKVRSLEALERKLHRQQDALEAAKKHQMVDHEGKPLPPEEQKKFTRDAVKGVQEQIRKTEEQIRRAEKALADMERKPEMRQELEKALAAWREANPNDAARAIRQMQQERDSLREYVKLLGQEARLTTPENRRMLPSDIRKLARNLVKEGSSNAAVEEIAEQLQQLGDFMVEHLEGADTGYFNQVTSMARKIAEQIVSESYETLDENKETREGIRRYLREHTLRISDVRGDIPDFNAWRKAHMGTLRLGNEGMDIDQAYQDLRSEYGEGLFPEDVLSRSDQLQQILEALDQVQPTYQQMFSRMEQEQAAAALGNEIVDRLLSKEVREKDSMADRAFQQRMKQLEEKYARKDRARQQALENAEDRAFYERIKRDEAEERRKEERALRRQLVAEKVHELRERSIERDRIYKKRISIEKKTVALSKIMLENSGKRHVPDAWKETIGDFLASIDTLTQRSDEKSRAFYLERVEALQKMVQRQLTANRGEEGGEGTNGFFLINPLIEEMLDPFVKLARESDTGKITLTKLSLEQLQELEEIMVTLRKAVDTSNEMISLDKKQEVSALAEKTLSYVEPLGEAKGLDKVWKRRLRKYTQFDNLTPVYYFKMLGQAGEEIFRSLQNGQGREAFNVKQIIAFTNGTKGQKGAYTEDEVKSWEKETHEFQLVKRESDLSGRESLTKAAAESGPEGVKEAEEKNKSKVTLSTAQIMGLYCLARREQARGHILGGGIRIWDIEAKSGTKTQADRYLVKAEDIAAITSTLTDRQKEVADSLQKYMNTVGSSWGNEVSRKLYGVDLFTEENYYPIETDPKSRAVKNPDADNTDLFRLANMGFTKSTVKNADNGVVLHSIFDVFSAHMSDMARYNAMCLPVIDAMKWFNYLDDGENHFTSVRGAIEKAYGVEAEKYFLTLIQDINGYQAGRGDYVGGKMVSNAKVAAVGANLRVAFLQPTSYVRALAVLDPKYMRKISNLKIKQGIEEAMQYSGTANWKDLGFFDLNVNANVKDLIKHADTTMDKIKEGSMWLAEKGDRWTWGALWNATKAEVQDKTGLTGEALMKATAERFDDVIYQTQVMDSVLTRSQMMRKKDGFHGMVTSFMAEPTLSYNLLLNSLTEWENAKRSGKGTQEARKKIARAFTVYALSQIVASFVESFFDALRDDDDYESFWEKWLQAEIGKGGKFMDGNLMQDLAPWSKLPYLRDLVSIWQGFTNKRMDTEWMNYWVTAIKALVKDWMPNDKGEVNGFTWSTAYKTMRALSTTTGLPIGNSVRDVMALWNGFVVQNVPGWKLKTWKTTPTKPEASIKQAFEAGAISEEEAIRYLMRDAEIETEEKARQKVFEWSLEKGTKKYDKLLNAVYGGKDSKAARDELLQAGFSEDTLRSQVRTAVKAWYQGTAEDGRPRIDKEAAIRMLVKEGGMSQRDAEAKVREWSSFVSSPEKLQYEDIQDAYIAGEITAARAAEMRMLYGGKSKSEAQEEVQKWACEKETGIAYSNLQEAWLDGEISDAEAVEYQMKYGGQTKVNAEKTLQKWRYVKDTGGDYNDVKQGFLEGTISEQDAIDARVTYGGQTKIDAQKEIRKWTCEKETGIDYDDMKDAWLDGEISDAEAMEYQMKYGGQTKYEAEKTVREWTYTKDTGHDYDKLQQEYVKGELSKEQSVKARMHYGGQTRVDAEKEVRQWDCEKETGIRYSKLQELYLGGELDGARASELQVQYGGKTQAEAKGEVLHWQCEKDTGVKYVNIRDAYVGQEISRKQAGNMLAKYGGYNEEAVESKLKQYDFAGTDPNLKDVSEKSAELWYSSIEGSGISKEQWYKAYKETYAFKSDKDSKGKTIKDSLLNKRAAYIDSLQLNSTQKDLIFLAFYKESNLRKTPWH